MTQPEISVLVPVYNTKQYLRRCTDSVFAQSFREFELILVDDGSTDGSGVLCDEIAAQDARVVTVHQPNGGLAAARNTGLRHARGGYVLFLDSDDLYLRADALELLAGYRGEADLICFDYFRVGAGCEANAVSAGKSGELRGDKKSVVTRMVQANVYTASACLKLISRALLEEYALRFPLETRSEDIPFSLELLVRAERPVYCAAKLYGYFAREGSITHSLDARVVSDTLRMLDRLPATLNKADELYNVYMSYVAFQYCTLLINARLALPPTTPAQWNEIYAKKGLLHYDKNRIVRMVRTAARVLGVRGAAALLYRHFTKKQVKA